VRLPRQLRAAEPALAAIAAAKRLQQFRREEEQE
jgi:hypothetical protein